jgi:hypothetical protein
MVLLYVLTPDRLIAVTLPIQLRVSRKANFKTAWDYARLPMRLQAAWPLERN